MAPVRRPTAENALVHETGFYPEAQAVTVTVRTAGASTTRSGVADGVPISGYDTIRVDSLDDAVAWAANLPVAGKGTLEVRQVVEFDS